MSVATLRYEAGGEGASSRLAPALQRGRGAARISFARCGADSSLSHLYQQTPCRVLFPRAEDGEPPLAVLLTTSGGLAGGDDIVLSVAIDTGAAATVTTQAAEKIYRSLGPSTTISVDLTVDEGGWLEYLPQETILFDKARLERRTGATVAKTGRLLAAETVMFGRAARGERFAQGLLHDAWRVRWADRLIWADALRLEGDVAAALDDPFALDGAAALATGLYVGADAARHLELARHTAEGGSCRAGATLVGGMILARFLGPRADIVRRDLGTWLATMRHACAGLAPCLPRIWHN